ncbi:MAG: hypothetical protein COV46_03625 [Deltaproteobacteria bacterium CG11_big_fil_rev_8_21_14_0_20_49_13]|nr:MAG: hypothetical protein COV46_03625 [Deltaproteobacteria bacterium CG11_big_fil_rev_8_21_14_0_20_49_13]
MKRVVSRVFSCPRKSFFTQTTATPEHAADDADGHAVYDYAFIGYATFGHIADKIGRRSVYTLFSIIMAAGLLMVTVFFGAFVSMPHLILICMFMVGWGTGMFGGYGPLFSEIFPTHIRGTAMGTAFNLARGVQFFTPIIITMVAAHYGLAGGISLAAFFALLTGIWVWTLPETNGKRLVAD